MIHSIKSRGIAALLLSLAPVLVRAGVYDIDRDELSNDENAGSAALEEIVVTAGRPQLIGNATTASEGVVANDALALAPVYRPGQLLETVPGLVATTHSGEGKANQYLLRGYNLDHGTDLAVFVDEMPVNEPSHAHGQGYSDLNFLIPELATDIHYTKGTYYAAEGDFASVGAVHVGYLDTIPDQLSVSGGSWGFERFFTSGTVKAANGNLLGALELQHYDGPWVTPGDQRKINAVLRYSAGDQHDGYSLTGSFYHALWNNQTDQPERAISKGFITRFGELDPSDQGAASRANLSGEYFATMGRGQFTASYYAVSNHFSLVSNFTHFLVDPVNGDQEDVLEDRSTIGGATSYAYAARLLGFDHDLLIGFQARYDFLDVSRIPTRGADRVPGADYPLGFSERGEVRLGSNGVYAQATTHWSERFRTALGLREDYQYGADAGTNPGANRRVILEPKASLIFSPAEATEFYVSGGRGFHSDDIRGVNHARIAGIRGAPLIATQVGEEVGIRQELFERKVALTLVAFNLDAQSETTYQPDAGMDSAGPASGRYGYELNLTYQALRWLELYGSLSQDHARFKTPLDDGTGHVGKYLPNAPIATGSFAAYVKNLGPWSGGLELRYLGAYPLSSDDVVKGAGYHEWNGDVRYAFRGGWNAALGIYNIANTKADAMQFWYVDRLPGERATGVADVHIHPLEPLSARITIAKSF